MSDTNNQNKNNIITSVKEPDLSKKTSLENLNLYLQELHKNILRENDSKNNIKTSQSNEKEENSKNNPKWEQDKFFEEIKEDKSEEMKEGKNDEMSEENINNSDTSDKIRQININKIINANDYKSTMDINIINSIGINKKKNLGRYEGKKKENEIKEEKEENKENEDNNNIKDNTNKEEIEKKVDIENIQKINEIIDNKKDEIEIVGNEEKINHQNSFKEYSQFVESKINIPEESGVYNIGRASESSLNEIIDKLGGPQQNRIIKDDIFDSSNNIENKIIEKNNNSDSVKIDSKEDLKLRLSNIPLSEEKDNLSLLTNELNKAIIRTKDWISNISSDVQQDTDEAHKKLSKKNSKNSNEKKNGFEIFLPDEQNKEEHVIIEETKKEIIHEIDNMYENKLNLVKINNKEKFTYITKYNDPDKDKLKYESDYYYKSKNSVKFLFRRNKFLSRKYFSYILSNLENNNNLEEKNNINKDKKNDSIDSYDNFQYDKDEINKFKKNYDEQIEPITINLNYIRANSQNNDIKECKIYDIEDMTSFFYYFNLYSPEEDFKKVLEEKSENDILKSFTSYRKILNDGNSFKRAFSYLLLENFILQNKTKKLDYIIYDIKRLLGKKFKDTIKVVCNLLIDIKENSSIDYLMNSYNNPNLHFDEVMIAYIEDSIKSATGSSKNKNKYQEIDFNILRILCNVFEINLEIFYIEEDLDSENDNEILKMKTLILNNDDFIRVKNNIKASSYSECDSSITFRLLFFLNAYYIVYTKKSDIDSTLANNNNEKQYYYISSLPKYKCPNCKKNTGLDIIPSYEAIFCHICLTKYLQEILEKRAILYVKSNFSCIEYYTRPIKITSDIPITFCLYKYITKNYITQNFDKIVGRICFRCFEIFDKDKINKLKCRCQLCDNCLEKLLKENIKKKVCLNKYELNTIVRTKCLCQNEVDLVNLMELSKNKPTEKDKKDAEDRLLKVIKKRCCLCKENNEYKIFEFKILDGPPHFKCINCHEKELKSEENIKNKTFDNKNTINNNEIKTNEYESNDTTIKDKTVIKKKFFCKICFEEHTSIEDSETEHQNLIGRVVKMGEGRFKCCKGKCIII